jgi:hypothetical protein
MHIGHLNGGGIELNFFGRDSLNYLLSVIVMNRQPNLPILEQSHVVVLG